MKSKYLFFIQVIFLLTWLNNNLSAGSYVFSVKGNKTFLNDQEILVAGLRCSNALYSAETAADLIDHLDEYKSYGVNTISVFVMGSRFGNFKGYFEDASLNQVYAERLARIIKAADEKGMIVLVGCLYWGGSTAKWESWTQKEANLAVANTVVWLKENNFRNVFIDVDNEGMAMREAGFDPAGLVHAAKSVDPGYFVATNFTGIPPKEADLGIHFSYHTPEKPYIESEGTPINAPGGYWPKYSRTENPVNYINIGIYNDDMKLNQIELTRDYFSRGWGYMLASTWLQCVPPFGPNADPGGDGSAKNPGIRWWLEALKEMRGEYVPPQKNTVGFYVEEGGRICLEPEHYQHKIDRRYANQAPEHYWKKQGQIPGFTGDGYMAHLPDFRCQKCPEAPRSPRRNGGPELVWNVEISTPGKYYIWVRGYSEGGESNGCHIAVDGNFMENGAGTNISGFRPHKTWVWENKHKEYAKPPIIILKKGKHTIHLFGRDDGFRCDQVVLVNDAGFIPEGNAYPESRFVPHFSN